MSSVQPGFAFTANQYKCALYNLTGIEIGKCLMHCIAHLFQPQYEMSLDKHWLPDRTESV